MYLRNNLQWNLAIKDLGNCPLHAISKLEHSMRPPQSCMLHLAKEIHVPYFETLMFLNYY